MRLDSRPGPAPVLGEPGDFASSPKAKKEAAGVIETELEPNTKRAAGYADDATNAAQRGFDGWDTAAGLHKVADTWSQQVKALMGRLAGEKAALRGASGLFVRNDVAVRDGFGSQSKLNHL
ncbi:hypothetical protein ACFW7J_08720 [Streptomyces sp. NPDC059525]|uniref:hypothetical protein n=1 Tax=Streptomyces sp. NPDC059525 TaxID=3346857 RepID=UPI0036B13860